jgi:DNA polymerase-3 subunit alpha
MGEGNSSKQRPFVHLHLHSQFSLLDGAIKINNLLERCSELGMPAVAVTDHGVMFGAVQLMRAAKNFNVKPIVGCELYVTRGDYRDKSDNNGKPNHITLLVKNEVGYLNLIKLVTESFISGFYRKPRVDKNLLREHTEGLICLSGCLNGEVAGNIVIGQEEAAETAARELNRIYGEGNFFLEIQDHGLREQKIVKEGVAYISRKLGIPLVVTNDCHYILASDAEAHDALLCIGTGKVISDQNRLRYTSDQYYLKSGNEMAQVFGSEFEEALDNTLRIADLCDFEIKVGEYHLPRYAVPEGETIDSYFEKRAREGFEKRLPEIRHTIKSHDVQATEEDYRRRLDNEIAMIEQTGFSGYFLIVWDFIRFAKENGIPVGPGRGSGAGSLVAYSLGITGLDPIRFDLLFERFINPERVTMPDFDIDFCMRRRGEVIEYVRNKYGWKNVSQIITFGTLAARNAIRDVGRVMEIPYAEVDRVAKLIPLELGVTIEKALEDSPDLAELYKSNPQIKNVIDIARKLEGLTRHASTHAAGVVIAPKPLLHYLPLYKSSKDEITTQYDMNDVEAIGLIKMDFLGLRTLTVIQDTVNAIREALGREIDIDSLPLDDNQTFKLLSEGRTCGIFQFESSGMRDILIRMKPERLEDLSALNALYRPGPIKGGLIDDFIKRRHGKTKVEYLLPEMEEITKETLGIILYQEQVMQIASRLAGFSLGQADLLRRAMGKKKKKLMSEQRSHFIKGALQRGITKDKAEEVFELMAYFSGYGFNKSHSTAYALIAYQTAYLKAHYPQFFMAALLSSEMENTDKVKRYLAECRDMGIEILPPDVNRSQADFKVEGDAVRFGLAAIKGIGRGAIESIVLAREQNGEFRGLFPFCENVDLRAANKRVVEALIKSGSMDCFKARRAQLLAVVDKAFESGQKAMRDRISGQESLFGLGGDVVRTTSEELPEVDDWSEKTRLAYEKDVLGFYISGHPLKQFEHLLSSAVTAKIEDLAEKNREEVSIGGIITGMRRMRTRAGKAMAVFHLEDDTGSVETVVFPDVFNDSNRRLDNDEVVLVTGRAENDSESVRLIATGIMPLSQIKPKEPKALRITLDLDSVEETAIGELIEIIHANRGSSALQMRIRKSGEFDVEMATGGYFNIKASNGVLARLQRIVGEENIKISYELPAKGLP